MVNATAKAGLDLGYDYGTSAALGVYGAAHADPLVLALALLLALVKLASNLTDARA